MAKATDIEFGDFILRIIQDDRPHKGDIYRIDVWDMRHGGLKVAKLRRVSTGMLAADESEFYQPLKEARQ